MYILSQCKRIIVNTDCLSEIYLCKRIMHSEIPGRRKEISAICYESKGDDVIIGGYHNEETSMKVLQDIMEALCSGSVTRFDMPDDNV